MKPIGTLGIVGLGLMGGSLGLAARRRGVARRVVGYARREATRADAVRQGMVDTAWDAVAEAVRESDVVVFCLPVLAIAEAIRECRGAFRDGCVVTDVGSTKGDLARAAAPLLAGTGAVFVGSHPIAGSHRTGLEAARADLYAGATVVITPSDESTAVAEATVRGLWEGVGSVVQRMTPDTHDAVLARTSHLPHMVAAALVHSVLAKDPTSGAFCGGGFRDTTRVAGSSEVIWRDIVRTNRVAVARELDIFAAEIAKLRECIDQERFEELTRWLGEARALRESIDGPLETDT